VAITTTFLNKYGTVFYDLMGYINRKSITLDLSDYKILKSFMKKNKYKSYKTLIKDLVEKGSLK